ncbi:DUF4426 domain-containing protein [Litoribrevibacter euphylliae]|uniref:DUF4426 domain-containing protein n=1 Tax=Litoribrevibacter euphylliae TaxID=1834034 RepID=A0ABV7HIQ4_9GAMM
MDKRPTRFSKPVSLIQYLTFFFALITASVSWAEQKQVFGDYEVHYSAFNSAFLQPKIAESYGIQRSKYRGVVNITVLKKGADGSTTPVRAFIKGKVKNLIEQTNNLNFRPIIESDAIYHIAEFKISTEDTLTFNLDVQPDPNKPALVVSFRQAVYPE